MISDIILDRLAKGGYSLSEAGWIRASEGEFYFEVTAEKRGHRHIVRALNRETSPLHLAQRLGIF